MSKAFELKLHSPAGSDPDVYEWPLTYGRGAVSNCCHYSYLGIPLLVLVLNQINVFQIKKNVLIQFVDRH
jgi:hypothetical protein